MRKLRPYQPTFKEILNKDKTKESKVRGSTVNNSRFSEPEMQNQKGNCLKDFFNVRMRLASLPLQTHTEPIFDWN
jgi:hypothetical protein